MASRWWRPSRLYLWSGVALALVGLVMLHSYMAQVARADDARALVPVVVAATNVPRGATLGQQHLRILRIPRAYAPPGSYRTTAQAAGRVTLADLADGEAVTRTRLARVRAGPVASLIPEGLRAFAVPSSLPGGTVQAGDLVDVLATYTSDQPRTEAVVTGVQVLFVLGAGSSGPAPSGEGSGGSPGALDM